MEIPLTVVLTLVVILIVAVIVLVIFQGGLGPAVEFGSAQSACRQSAGAICASTGSLPATWNVPTNKVKETDSDGKQSEVFKSCQEIVTGAGGGATCVCDPKSKQLTGC